MKITENTTKEELLTNGYLTLHQFGQEMKTMIRRNAKEMGKKLAYKREMENMYYKNIEKSGEQFNFSNKITYA
jgi:hypothetical protein